MTDLTRRTLIASAAAAPLVGLAAGSAHAKAPKMGASFARHRRFMIGDFEVTTILGGTGPRENPQGIFGMNVSQDEFNAVSKSHFLSTELAQFFFTPTVVNTGSELVLFDTGLNADATVGALESAGYGARSGRYRCVDPYARRSHWRTDAQRVTNLYKRALYGRTS